MPTVKNKLKWQLVYNVIFEDMGVLVGSDIQLAFHKSVKKLAKKVVKAYKSGRRI